MQEFGDRTVEVVVVDSGSKDATIQEIRQIEGDMPFALKIFEIAAADFGHGKTRNYLAQVSSGKILVFITQDAYPADRFWLRYLIEPLERGEAVCCFSRHVAHRHASPITALSLQRHFEGIQRNGSLFRLDDPVKYNNDAGYRQLLHFYSNNSSAMTRDIWMKYPYPEVEFGEDQIWARMIIEAGYTKAYAHQSIIEHSHEYGFKESLMRSFDEARLFFDNFGYVLCSRLSSVLVGAWAHTKLSYYDLRHLGQPVSIAIMLRIFFISICVRLGHWLGSRCLPSWLQERLSITASHKKR
jgi:rhamnosyltransferase